MLSDNAILNAKILIVDDCANNVYLLQEILRHTGYTSVTATTRPEQVCPLHKEHGYDLILLDLQMPGVNGFQVMQELKQIEQDQYLPGQDLKRERVERRETQQIRLRVLPLFPR